MERKIDQTVKLKEIYFDEDLYPRISSNWQVAYDYSQSILAGAIFPKIILAAFHNKLYLVDGKHRLDAYKLLKLETIEAEVFTGWNKKRIFEEAVRQNISHGKVLSPFEKRRIALKLRTLNYRDNKISKLIQIPKDKLDSFIAQRLVNTLTGEEIVKSEIKHIAGRTIETDIKAVQKEMHNRNQISMLNEIILLIEKGLLDLGDEGIQEALDRLRELLFDIEGI